MCVNPIQFSDHKWDIVRGLLGISAILIAISIIAKVNMGANFHNIYTHKFLPWYQGDHLHKLVTWLVVVYVGYFVIGHPIVRKEKKEKIPTIDETPASFKRESALTKRQWNDGAL